MCSRYMVQYTCYVCDICVGRTPVLHMYCYTCNTGVGYTPTCILHVLHV